MERDLDNQNNKSLGALHEQECSCNYTDEYLSALDMLRRKYESKANKNNCDDYEQFVSEHDTLKYLMNKYGIEPSDGTNKG